jgi:hypothetical protein
MQWIEQRAFTKDQILGVYGLNKIAIGDYEDINFATIQEGRRMLWEDTYLPLDKMIWDALNNQWIRYLDNGQLRGRSDYRDIDALQKNNKSKVDQIVALINAGYAPELAARTVGIPISDADLERWPYLSEMPPKYSAPAPASGGISVETSSGKSSSIVVVKNLSSEHKQTMLAEYIERVLDKGEQGFHKTLQRFFYRQRNLSQDKVDAWLQTQKTVKAMNVSIEMFDLDKNEEDSILIRDIFTPAARIQMELEREQLKKELGTVIAWNVTDPGLQKMVNARRAVLSGINSLTFEKQRAQVSDVISQSLSENWTPQQTAKKIKETLSELYKTRTDNSKTIARTEMGSVASMARFDAFRREGIDASEWLTSNDSKVRDDDPYNHVDLNEEHRKLGEIFARNLRYPRDPHGDAGDVINCRCVAVAYFEE